MKPCPGCKMQIADDSETCLQCKDNIGGPALLAGVLIPLTLIIGGLYWYHIGGLAAEADAKEAAIAPLRPSTAKVLTPAGARVEKPADKTPAMDIEGIWSHTIKDGNGDEKTVVLKAMRGDSMELIVGYYQQYFSYKPVLERALYEKGRLKLDFGLVTYGNETPSGKRVEYRLKQQDSWFEGTMTETGKKKVLVTLSRWPQGKEAPRRKATID